MAAGLGFKDFQTGEVLTAADVDGYLMQGIWVFASAAARSAAVTSPQEGNYSFLKDTNSTEYYDGSAWVAAGGGGGGGKVLQVVSATTTTQTTVQSTTMTDSGLSITITPTLSTSKVLILVSQQVLIERNNTAQSAGWRLLRGATQIFDGDGTLSRGFLIVTNNQTELAMGGYPSISYLDSPATTSATTYKTQGKVEVTTNNSAIRFQHNNCMSSIIALEIGA
jgi:hypothetical protein